MARKTMKICQKKSESDEYSYPSHLQPFVLSTQGVESDVINLYTCIIPICRGSLPSNDGASAKKKKDSLEHMNKM